MKTTRRQVVKQLGLTALALSAGGCASAGAAGPGGSTTIPSAMVIVEPSPVAVQRPTAFPSFEEAVKATLSLAGGLSFVREGQSVLIKPATNSSEAYPATSDPELVFLIAKLVKEAGGEPFVADRTMFMRNTASTFHKLGLDAAAKEAKVSCRSLDYAEVTKVPNELAVNWGGTVPIYRPVLEADHVINLCTPRTHAMGDFTMALKNLVGVVDAGARLRMHLPGGFKERLAELSLVVRPSLIVMDGRRGFTNGGPDSGDLAAPDFLAVARDPLAIDAVGLAFLRLSGANARLMRGSVWDLPVMKRAAELGVGARSLSELSLLGLGAEDELAVRRQLA